MTHLSGNRYSILVWFFVVGSVPVYILGVCVRCVLIRGTFQNLTGRGWRVEVRRKLDVVPLNLWCRELALTIGMRCGRGFASYMTPLIEHENDPTIISQTSLDRKAYILSPTVHYSNGVKVEWTHMVTRTHSYHGVDRYYPNPHSFFCGPTQHRTSGINYGLR